MLQPAQHCEVAEHHILPPTQRHTLHLSILQPSVQHCFQPGRAVRLPNSIVSYFLYPQAPFYSEWESGKKGSEERERIGHIISLW